MLELLAEGYAVQKQMGYPAQNYWMEYFFCAVSEHCRNGGKMTFKLDKGAFDASGN